MSTTSANPKCELCGGRHLTAAKECKERYQMPYLVRRRCAERSRGQQKQVSGLRQGQPTVSGPHWLLRGLWMLQIQEPLSASYLRAFRTPFQVQQEIQAEGHIWI
ncbi:hypothetical protein MTO96_034012 [Rhipicephalus appendiculatus]